MKEREYLIELYMIYGCLLTDKQQDIFEKYFYEDLSLSEISENTNISKSYIGKTINTINDKLNYYESSLKIYEKNKTLLSIITDSKLKEKTKKIISG